LIGLLKVFRLVYRPKQAGEGPFAHSIAAPAMMDHGYDCPHSETVSVARPSESNPSVMRQCCVMNAPWNVGFSWWGSGIWPSSPLRTCR